MNISYNTPEEFLSDESFTGWAMNSDKQAIEVWERWLLENPGRKDTVDEALQLFKEIYLQENIAGIQIEDAELRLLQTIKNNDNNSSWVGSVPFYRKYWWAVAASLLLIAGTAVWGMYLSKSSIETAYGQTLMQHLPDGSEVMLNANSSVSYNKGWKEGNDREVWIKGEAFFHVKKTVNHSRFVVHANHFDIVVTGTQFNVVNRNDKMNVMLTEGSVIIKTDDGKEIHMKPGDFVELNNNDNVPEKKEVKNENVLAWKDHKLVFDNITMTDVAKMIEDQYGITIKLADDAIADKKISGIMPNDNIDMLLQSLEATTDFKVEKNGNEIIIEEPSN